MADPFATYNLMAEKFNDVDKLVDMQKDTDMLKAVLKIFVMQAMDEACNLLMDHLEEIMETSDAQDRSGSSNCVH